MAKRREIALILLKIPLQMLPKCFMRAGFSLFPSLCPPRPAEFSQPSLLRFIPNLSGKGPLCPHLPAPFQDGAQQPARLFVPMGKESGARGHHHTLPQVPIFSKLQLKQPGAEQVGEQGPLGAEVRRPPSVGLRIWGSTPSTLLSEHP